MVWTSLGLCAKPGGDSYDDGRTISKSEGEDAVWKRREIVGWRRRLLMGIENIFRTMTYLPADKASITLPQLLAKS